jgi:hypothetical protein
MEGVEILEGETCPKCGRPGARLSTLEGLGFLALGDEAEKTIVHSYTRRQKDAPPPNEKFEVSASFGGCRLP